MGYSKFFENMIEDKILEINVAYVAKVLSCTEKTATVQPLTMVKQYGEKAQAPAVVSDIPILESAKYKMGYPFSTISYVKNVTVETKKSGGYVTDVLLNVEKGNVDVIIPTDLAVGDLVFCVCSDRNSTEAKNGEMSTPPVGHHSLSDSFIVGIL